MTQSARTKTWQRVIDCIIGALLASIGSCMFAGWIAEPIQHEAMGLCWAVLLGVAGLAVIAGAILRTIRPGTRQSVGFQFELVGWGPASFLILWYASVSYYRHPDPALFLALMLIAVMLFASWMRLVAAMRQATRIVRRRHRDQP